MNLPAPRRQPNATPAGQPLNHPYPPVAQPRNDAIELYGERPTVVYVPSAENPSVMVGVPKQYVQPMQAMPARDLTPQPLLDPIAQRLVAAGAGGGVLLWGGGQFLVGLSKALAAATGGGALLLALLAVGARVAFANVAARASSGGTYNHNEIHVEQKWLGRTGIDIHNN